MTKVEKLFLILFVIFLFAFSSCSQDNSQNSSQNPSQYEQAKIDCENLPAIWNEEYSECETSDSDKLEELETYCKTYEGEFNECNSACRHNKDPNIACIMVCVSTCSLK